MRVDISAKWYGQVGFFLVSVRYRWSVGNPYPGNVFQVSGRVNSVLVARLAAVVEDYVFCEGAVLKWDGAVGSFAICKCPGFS